MSWYWSISLLDDVVFIPDSLDFTVFYADLAETVDFGMGNCFHLLHKMRQPNPPRIRDNIPPFLLLLIVLNLRDTLMMPMLLIQRINDLLMGFILFDLFQNIPGYRFDKIGAHILNAIENCVRGSNVEFSGSILNW